MEETRQRTAVIAVLIIGAATITAAWAFELFGGYPPCPLCLQQRWAYYLVVPLSLSLWLRMNGHARRPIAIGLAIITVAMLANAGLGFYHAGIEWKWWAGPQFCAVGAGLSGGLPDLSTAQAVACDEAPWRFMGLSFAGWNVIVSLVLAGLALWGALARRQGSSSVSQ